MLDGVMAKKKQSQSKPVENWVRKPLAIQMRGSEAWKDWVDRGAKQVGLKVPSLIDQALRLYFRENGFVEPPPER